MRERIVHLRNHLRNFSIFLFFLLVATGINANAAGGASHPATASAQTPAKAWAELSPIQKAALSPLEAEWNKLGESQRIKWIEISQRFPSMKQNEQKRIQERMRSWVLLTPDQRMAARENYALTTKLSPSVKSAKWQEYQQLSNAEKKRLAETNAQKKARLANLPTPAQREVTPLKPLKVGPKHESLKSTNSSSASRPTTSGKDSSQALNNSPATN